MIDQKIEETFDTLEQTDSKATEDFNLWFLIEFSEEVDRLARECRMRLYRTSVKEDINVGGLFQHLAENYVNKLRSSPPPTSTSSSSYDSVDSGKNPFFFAKS